MILYAAALRIVLFVAPPLHQTPAQLNLLGALFYNSLNSLIGSRIYIYHLIAFALVIIQAFYFNYIVNNNRLFPSLTFLPAFSYVLMSSLFPEFMLCTPALIGFTFLLMAFGRIAGSYKRESVRSLFFDAGFFVSLASLFFFPYLVFIIFLFAALAIIRPFNPREYVIMVLGLFVPYYLTGVYFYWNEQLPEFISTLSITQLHFNFQSLEKSSRLIVEAVPVMGVCIWSVLYAQRNFFRMVVQVRLFLLVTAWFVAAGALSLFVRFSGELFQFVWIIIPAALGFSFFFSEVKKKRWAEIIHLVVLLSIVFFQYFDALK